MIKFVLFLKKISFILLFVMLEILAIRYYANSTSYTKVKLVTASNYVVGGIYSQLSGVSNYFHLKSENRMLSEEVASLKNQLDGYLKLPANDSIAQEDSLLSFEAGPRHFEYHSARVVNNSITHQENYITLNCGEEDGIEPNMALISDGGIVGYVLSCSDHFTVCMSILNRNFKTSGRIKGSEYFGSIFWDGTSFEHVTLTEIPKYAAIQMGDTIVTTDYSSIFPPDVMIGTVEHFELINATYYEVRVRLKSNVAALGNILLVKDLNAGERNALENSVVNPTVY